MPHAGQHRALQRITSAAQAFTAAPHDFDDDGALRELLTSAPLYASGSETLVAPFDASAVAYPEVGSQPAALVSELPPFGRGVV